MAVSPGSTAGVAGCEGDVGVVSKVLRYSGTKVLRQKQQSEKGRDRDSN